MRRVARITAIAALGFMASFAAHAQEPAPSSDPGAVRIAPPGTAPSRALGLGVGRTQAAGGYAIFGGSIGPGPGPAPAAWLPGLLPANRPMLRGMPHYTLGEGLRIGTNGQGRPAVLSFGPWSRGWDDLDAWEKAGVVLQTAAEVAAAARFAGIVAHKIRF
jgi:hypothetical protein